MDWNSDTFERVVKLIGDFDTNSDISEIMIELIGELGVLFWTYLLTEIWLSEIWILITWGMGILIISDICDWDFWYLLKYHCNSDFI